MSNKVGRPAGPRGAYNPVPARQLGRVTDEEWDDLKLAAKAKAMPFSHWALTILNREAKKILNNSK